jgi:hypothetical protein
MDRVYLAIMVLALLLLGIKEESWKQSQKIQAEEVSDGEERVCGFASSSDGEEVCDGRGEVTRKAAKKVMPGRKASVPQSAVLCKRFPQPKPEDSL